MADSKSATLGIVLNMKAGGFALSKKGKELLIKEGMSPKRVELLEDNLMYRFDPILVDLVRRGYTADLSDTQFCTLYVAEIPICAIMTDAFTIEEDDGIEGVEYFLECAAKWPLSTYNIGILKELGFTIPVPDELSPSDNEDDE
jgi:hypothetical protein